VTPGGPVLEYWGQDFEVFEFIPAASHREVPCLQR
jgi:hypothetical protein